MSSFKKPPKLRRNRKSVVYLLQKGTPESIQQAKDSTCKLVDYHWNFYSELAQQRKIYRHELLQALKKAAKSIFKIDGWQRSIKFKYSNHPLSTIGSITFIGGRFNSGSDINPSIASLHALYLAVDKDTALQEQLGQEPSEGLTPQEIALTRKDSISTLCISGLIESYIDLNDKESLMNFVSILKKFKVSPNLTKESNKVNEREPDIIKSLDGLMYSLLDPNWKIQPANYDIPSNSQIFGQLVCDAGIQAILYPSKLSKKPCLVVFPQNFENTKSYIQLDGEIPSSVVVRQLNHQNWKLSSLTIDDITEFRKSDQTPH